MRDPARKAVEDTHPDRKRKNQASLTTDSPQKRKKKHIQDRAALSRPRPGHDRENHDNGNAPDPQQTAASILLGEIRALGGDERDLELIKDVSSDIDDASELVGGAVDKVLRSELQELVADLGFSESHASPASDSADSDEDVGNGNTEPHPTPLSARSGLLVGHHDQSLAPINWRCAHCVRFLSLGMIGMQLSSRSCRQSHHLTRRGTEQRARACVGLPMTC